MSARLELEAIEVHAEGEPGRVITSAAGMVRGDTMAERFAYCRSHLDGLRQLILGGIDQRLWQALIFLGALWFGSILLTALAARRNQLWNLTRLVPSVKM